MFKQPQETIEYWAERKVKADAHSRSKTMCKREVNRFYYSDKAVARMYFGISEQEFVQMRDAYIAENPMRYAPTTGNLTYLKKVAA